MLKEDNNYNYNYNQAWSEEHTGWKQYIIFGIGDLSLNSGSEV